MNPDAKFHCSETVWGKVATKAAIAAGLNPVALLAGARARPYITVRWDLWRSLVERNYSYASIGQSSGFHHSTVMSAVRRAKLGKRPLRWPQTAPTKAQKMGAR